MKVVLGFAEEDAPLAEVLMTRIEETFAGQCRVVPSSDQTHPIRGTNPLEATGSTLEMATLYLVLISPASSSKTWLHFELACAWTGGIPVHCLSYAWEGASSLPSPFSAFPTHDMNAPAFVPGLLKIIGSRGDLKVPPSIDEDSMGREIAQAVSLRQSSVGTEIPNHGGTPPILATSANIEMEILKQFVEWRGKRYSTEHFSTALGMPEIKMQSYLDRLTEKGLLRRSPNLILFPPRYSLTREGRDFLVQNGLI